MRSAYLVKRIAIIDQYLDFASESNNDSLWSYWYHEMKEAKKELRELQILLKKESALKELCKFFI